MSNNPPPDSTDPPLSNLIPFGDLLRGSGLTPPPPSPATGSKSPPLASLGGQRSAARRGQPTLSHGPDDVIACRHCGADRHMRPWITHYSTEVYLPEDCPCMAHRQEIAERLVQTRHGEAERARVGGRQQQLRRLLLPAGMAQMDGLTLATFDPALLQAAQVEHHPFTQAVAWLNAALEAGPRATWNDGPACALYLYSPEPGRGKSHMAAGLAHEAAQHQKLVAYVAERECVETVWSAGFEEKLAILQATGGEPWLTVLDDLGRKKPSEGSRDVLGDLIGRRWAQRGWTIITSNFLPVELLDRGSIDSFAFSRLYQMIDKQVIYFDGRDVRLLDRGAG